MAQAPLPRTTAPTEPAGPPRDGSSRGLCGAHPWLPWIAPFLVYVVLLASGDWLPLGRAWNHVARLVLCGAIIVFCSRKLFSLRMTNPAGSVAIGIAVFAIWIAPDLLWEGYRSHWLFSNGIMGTYDPAANADMAGASPLFFVLRLAVSVLLVPILEELFWRGFVMRIVIRNDFERVPLGAWSLNAFLITAVLFALEHGFYWDVGLAAGLIYNAWMIRTKNLGDVIWAHAITNGLLAAFVMWRGAWQYWP